MSGVPKSFNVIELDTSEKLFSSATALNNRGTIVGAVEAPPCIQRACEWRNGAHALVFEGETSQSTSTGVNELGEVVGDITSVDGAIRACRWVHGRLQILPCMRNDWSRAMGINNYSHIVGWQRIDGTIKNEVVLWIDESPFVLDLGEEPDGTAYAINDHNDIVGSQDHGGILCGFLWQRGRVTFIGTDTRLCRGLGINNRCDIICSIEQGQHSYELAYLWSKGRLKFLGTLGSESYPTSINELGHVVGVSDLNPGDAPCRHSHGFLWHDGEMHDLNDLIDRSLDWEIESANGINNHCQIACTAARNEISRAVLLDPAW